MLNSGGKKSKERKPRPQKMGNEKIKILMFSAGLLSGSFRMMMDIIGHMDAERFSFHVTYKPEYAEWGKDEIRSILDAGAKIVPLRGKQLFDVRGFLDLWIALRSNHIDILHSWDVLGVPARIIGKLAGVKVVEELANPPASVPLAISLKHYLTNRITSVFVDGFVACSNEIRKRYYAERPVFLRNKIFSAIPNCVEIPCVTLDHDNIARLRKRFGIKDGEIVLTNIGYFNEQKAQSDLLKAFNTVVEKKSGVRLFIAGWGRLERDLKETTRDLGLDRQVTFTGKLSRSEVFELLAVTDLFVLSSHWEGFGIVMAEAMALGKPVLSTDTDGAREVVENGKTGLLVPVKRPDRMAETILRILVQPEFLEQMGRMGLERVAKHFNCEKFVKGYEKFYLDVLHGQERTSIRT